MIELQQLNVVVAPSFVEALAAIFEHSPWIAQRTAMRRPFGSRLDLLDAMRGVVAEATAPERLALINAHPRLGARGRPRQQLTQASSREQRRAGLDACSDEEFAQLQRLNATYEGRFDFPFILAVRGYDPPAIIAQMQRRLTHEREEEVRAAIHQIGLIASYRLADTVASHSAVEAAAMLTRWPGTQASALLTEWMRAASMTVWNDGDGSFVGTLPATAPTHTLLLGLHGNVGDGAVCDEGSLGWICALAVIQRLKELGRHLPYDLAVFARLESAAAGGPITQVLAMAGLAAVRVPERSISGSASTGEAPAARATRALEELLLHTPGHG